MPRKKKDKGERPMEDAMALTDFEACAADPQGSYTGVPAEPDELPVQDVDDL